MLGGIKLMRKLFKVTMLGLLMVTLTAGLMTTAMGQDLQAQKNAVYQKFLDHYDKKTVKDKETAIAAAKEYNSKFNKPEDKQLNDYFTNAITDLEKAIAKMKKDEADRIAYEKEQAEKKKKAAERTARLGRLNTAYNAITKNPTVEANWDEYFAAGEDVLKYEPNYVDVSIVLASAGSELPKELQSNTKLKERTVNYANKALSQIDLGATSADNKYGEFRWVYGSKDKALTWMNRIIGQIKGRTNRDAAMPYYYKATKYKTGSKDWNIYRIIGAWYYQKLVDKVKTREALDKTDETNIPEIKKSLAFEKGYAERAMDAYARAYKLAQTDSKVNAKTKANLFADLKKLFAFRYNDPKDASLKSDINIKSYVAVIDKRTMPNPETEVKPIGLPVEEPSEKSDEMKSGDSMKKDSDSMKKDGDSMMMKKPSAKAKTNGTTRTRTVSKTKKDN